MLSDGGLYKAEVVFIGDPEVLGSTGGPRQEPLPQCNPADHMTLPPPSPPIRAQPGHTAPNVVAAMETAVSERGGVPAWGPRAPALAEPHKIKLSYKALAAIPTNTLLLDQQAIDDSVETQGDHWDRLPIEDTHVERNPSPARWSSREFLDRGAVKPCTSSPRSMGRETKYATRHAPPALESSLQDHHTTRPGVIKPVNSSPRLTVSNNDKDDDGDGYHGNPFRQYMQDLSQSHSSKLESTRLTTEPGAGGCAGQGAGGCADLGAGGGRRTAPGGPLCLSPLLISEGERPHPPAEGDRLRLQPLCSPAQQPQALETHI